MHDERVYGKGFEEGAIATHLQHPHTPEIPTQHLRHTATHDDTHPQTLVVAVVVVVVEVAGDAASACQGLAAGWEHEYDHIECVCVSVSVHVCVAGELMLIVAAGSGVPRSDTPR